MSFPARTPRARPQGGGWDLAIWYLMRLTGVGLFVLALSHFLITHVVYDPAEQTAQWIIDERWANITWRTIDWLMLTLVVFHGFMGMRNIVLDYTRGGLRLLLTMSIYGAGIVLFLLGTIAVLNAPAPIP
jgi:succinate dehydrogenase / fumarate reductase membrane anchor subunit